MSIWTDKKGRVHVGIMLNGRRIHRCLPEGTSKSDAKLIEADLRKAAGQNRAKIPGDPSMQEIMGFYIEHSKNLRSPETAVFHAVRAGPWLEGKRASEVDVAVSKMVKDMLQHYKPGTINKTIGTIKTALKIAYRERVIPEDYGDRISRLPENNQRHNYLTIEDVKRIADNCSEEGRKAVWIALLTGCRRGEILKLKPEDVYGNRLRIQSGNTKTLKERTIPIVPAVRPWLEMLPIKITAEGLKSTFARARVKAGIPDMRFHDLRHSCASLLINMGVPLEVVRDILGHTTVKTTERYAHLQIDRQEEALLKLSEAVSRKN